MRLILLIFHRPQNVIFHEINVLIIRLLRKVKAIITRSKKEQFLNNTIKPKSSFNSGNRIVYKRFEILFYLWNNGKKKVKFIRLLMSFFAGRRKGQIKLQDIVVM